MWNNITRFATDRLKDLRQAGVTISDGVEHAATQLRDGVIIPAIDTTGEIYNHLDKNVLNDILPNLSKAAPPSVNIESPVSSDSPTDLRQMHSLVNDGYSLTSAAAIVGNTRHESGQYRHHEELKPNAYGTHGAGWFQWTDLDSTGGTGPLQRRTHFENFANQLGVAPTTFEANNGFMLNEMRHGDQWGTGSREEFMDIDDLGQATNYFSDIYLRPAPRTANNKARLNYARDSLARYQELLKAQN